MNMSYTSMDHFYFPLFEFLNKMLFLFMHHLTLSSNLVLLRPSLPLLGNGRKRTEKGTGICGQKTGREALTSLYHHVTFTEHLPPQA